MNEHTQAVVLATKQPRRSKRKRQSPKPSLSTEEKLRPSKRAKVQIHNVSSLEGTLHDTSSEKSPTNQGTCQRDIRTSGNTKINSKTLHDWIKPSKKQKSQGKQRNPASQKATKRPAEATFTNESDLSLEKQPTHRRRSDISSENPRARDTVVRSHLGKVRRLEKINLHSLPPELLSAIIEHVWEDGSALCASTLVCSIWRVAARPLVFRKIIIRNTEDMTKLARQIQYEPRVAFWIQTLRFEGKSVLRARLPAYTPSRDIDTWIYSFFSTIGAQLPNVKNLELFGFQHTSLCRADCHAFAEWIIQMSQLNSVQSLHLSRCEMPANALTAIIRSFSGLRNVALTCVSCRAIAPNEAGFVRLSDMSSDSFPTTKPEERSLDGYLTYPVLYPSPRLHALSIENELGIYDMFDFKLLQGWLRPARLKNSLRYFHGGGMTELSSMAVFLQNLGASPALTTLRLCVEDPIPRNHKWGSMNLSSLANLAHLIFDCPEGYFLRETMECICIMLEQVNTTRLEEITLRVSAKDRLYCIVKIDKSLRMDKFRNLKRFNLSVQPDPKVQDWGASHAKELAELILPSMEARGILYLVGPHSKAKLP